MISILSSLMVAALDQFVKHLVRNMPQGEVFFRINGLLELIPTTNTGAAFSILRGSNLALALASLVLMLFSATYIHKTMRLSPIASHACFILLGGGIGNLIDRLLFGGVTDYIRILFLDFPVFNLADVAITCSVFVLIMLLLTNRLEEHNGDHHG